MNRIGRSKLLLLKPFRPASRVIVQSNDLAASPQVRMVRKCEILETKRPGDILNRLGEFLFFLNFGNVFDEELNSIEHSGAAAAGVFQDTSIRSCPS